MLTLLSVLFFKFLQENEPKKCLGATNEVIYLDRNNAKAFYLRGKVSLESVHTVCVEVELSSLTATDERFCRR